MANYAKYTDDDFQNKYENIQIFCCLEDMK